MNKVEITGRIGSDVNLKRTQSGKAVLSITMAVKRNKEVTDWIPVVVWNQSAEFLAQYAKKGDLIEVTGQLQSRQYEQNGQKRTAYEVMASETGILSHSERNSGSNGGNPIPAQNQRQMGGNEPSWASEGYSVEIGSDDLPF